MVATLQGVKPWRLLRVTSVTVTFLTLGIATTSAASFVTSSNDLIANAKFDSSWRSASNAATLRFSGTNTEADFEALTESFRKLVTEKNVNGSVVLSKPPIVPRLSPGDVGPTTGNSLIVNREYLARNPVRDASGEPSKIAQPAQDELVLLIPESHWQERTRLVAEYMEWAHLQQDPDDSPITVRTRQIGSQQANFAYGANSFKLGSGLSGALLALVPDNATYLRDEFFVAAASNGALVFDDADALLRDVDASGLGRYVSAVDSVSELALAQVADRLRSLIGLSASLAATLMILTFSILIRASSYFEQRYRALRLQMLHGHTFWTRHASHLVASVVVGVVAFLLAIGLGIVRGPLALATALAVQLLYVGATLVVLWYHDRGLLRPRDERRGK
jgi:hypothetical protein